MRQLSWSKRAQGNRYVRLVRRLATMSGSEIAQRLRIALRKHPLIHARYTSRYLAEADRCADELLEALGPDPRSQLTDSFDRRFFFGPSDKDRITSLLLEHCGESPQATIRRANLAGVEGLSILGQTIQITPESIDWHTDPESGRRPWPIEWMDEAAATSTPDVDVKYVWELNRHQFLTVFGRAFWLTNEPKYARAAVELIDDWISANPPGRGVNWCSHLEVSMRSISWLWTMPFLLAWPELDSSFLQRWLRSLAHHYCHLKENLSVFTDPTNHLIGEATGLYLLAECFPDLPGAANEASRCREILERELRAQTHSDGVNREQATSYHRFVLDFYTQFLAVSRRLDREISGTSAELIEKMFEFAAAMAGSHGTAPMIGDSDDARGIPMPELVGWSFDDSLATGALLLDRADWWRSRRDLPECCVLLFHGSRDLRENGRSRSESGESPSIFPQGGYAFFEQSSQAGNSELIFDTGPLGLWPNASHGHADALSVLVRVDGNFHLTDSGTGAYFGPDEERNSFRATSAHNTVTVDDLDQADIFGTFKWVSPYRTELLDFYASGALGFARARHNGYMRLADPVMHERCVIALPSGGWIVGDTLTGTGAHSVVQYFHVPPNVEPQRLDDGVVTVEHRETQTGLAFIVPTNSFEPPATLALDEDGIWSTHYGDRQQSRRLTISTTRTLPLDLAVLITPVLKGESFENVSRARKLSIETMPNTRATAYHIESGGALTEVVLINRDGDELELAGSIKTNAQFLYALIDKDGSLERATISGLGARLESHTAKLVCRSGMSAAQYQRSSENPVM